MTKSQAERSRESVGLAIGAFRLLAANGSRMELQGDVGTRAADASEYRHTPIVKILRERCNDGDKPIFVQGITCGVNKSVEDQQVY